VISYIRYFLVKDAKKIYVPGFYTWDAVKTIPGIREAKPLNRDLETK
jgi:hypothetical protein